MTKQLFAHTRQVSYTSYAHALNGDADLDCKSIGWPIGSIYGLCSGSGDEVIVIVETIFNYPE